MGLRKLSIVGCFKEFCFSIFCDAGACGDAKAIYKQFCVITSWACAAGFNNNNNTSNVCYKVLLE